MDRVAEALRDRFGCLPFDVCVIGSRSAKDHDVVIIGRQAGIETTTRCFLTALRDVLLEVPHRVIVRHEHRSFVSPGEPLLHVIFYPSYAHLAVCEPPSFLASACEAGHFITGSREALEAPARAYRERAPITFSTSQLQAARYADLATANLIYLAAGEKFFSDAVVKELLLYALRFTIIETLVDAGVDGAGLWSWCTLIEHIEAHRPEQRTLAEWFRSRDDGRWTPSTLELETGFFAVLRLLEDSRALERGDLLAQTQISPSADR